MMKQTCVLIVVMVLAATMPARAEMRWYKGNLHTHSLWSDGDQFPEVIAHWYRQHGYHFLAMSDHNINGEDEKWIRMVDVKKKMPAAALEEYLGRYGAKIRTRGDADSAKQELRLRPLSEYRSEVEEPGRFLLIQAQEISDRLDKKPIHMNATNLRDTIKPQGGKTVREVIANNFRAIEEQSRRLGRPILPHLNHPNFGWGVTAEDIAHVVEERFFEVFNGHPQVNQLGDDDHPSIEKLWDIANTIRLAQLNAAPLMGLGTDDSHHYHVEGSTRSTSLRGWIMVRAEALSPESLIEAMQKGDFYASTGVTLREVTFDDKTRTIRIDIEPDGDAIFTTEFVGTAKDAASSKEIDYARVGQTFASIKGPAPTYQLKGNELYVRAIVTSSRPVKNPVLPDQHQQAWTQPVGWK